MRVEVDANVCEGHGQCAMVGEDVFNLDDDGFSFVTDAAKDGVPDELAEQARDGAASCPVQAITVHE